MKTKVEVPLEKRLKKRIDLLFKKKKQIFLFTIIGLLLSIGITLILPKEYKSDGSIVFKYRILNNSVFQNDINLLNEKKFFFSDENLGEVSKYLANKNVAVSVNDLKTNLNVSINEASTSLYLSAVSKDDKYSHEIVNLLIKKYEEASSIKNKTNLIDYAKSVKAIENRITEEIKEKIGKEESTSISTLSFQQDQNISRIAELESELEFLELENQFYQKESESIIAVLEEKYPTILSNITTLSNDKIDSLSLLIQQNLAKEILENVEKKMGNYQLKYSWIINPVPNGSMEDDYLNLVSSRINTLKTNQGIGDNFINEILISYIQKNNKISAIDFAKSTIFNTLTTLEDQFNGIPFSNLDYARETRNKKVRNLLLLKAKDKFAKLLKQKDNYLAEIDYVQYANEPQSYFKPDLTLNIIYGLLGGLLLGIVIAASGSETKKIDVVTSLEDLDDIEFKIVSQVPSFPAGSPLLFDSLKESAAKEIDPAIFKSFNTIETFLKYGSLDKTLKSVLITSTNDDEGKSSIASNVALELANSGNKVLLVDADLKQPNLHKFFKIKSTPSLAHYLFRKKELEEIIRKTQNPNLDLITCIEFPQNPSVIITSERMKHFIEQVQKMYDYIIYDTASIKSLKETIELTDLIDEVILVVRANSTKLTDVLSTQSLFLEHGNENFNIILNDVKI